MASPQLTSMDRYYKSIPDNFLGYDYYLSNSNNIVLLKNLVFSNLKADGTSPNIELNIRNQDTQLLYTKSYTATKSDFIIPSIKVNGLEKGTYHFDIYNITKSEKASVISNIVFKTLDYHYDFTSIYNDDISFRYKGSNIKNYNPLSKTLKAYISNNYLTNTLNLINYIYFVKEINYIYQSDSTVYKSYNFYNEGTFTSPNPIHNNYQINMDTDIKANTYLYQEVILYKGIEYNGNNNQTFLTKHNYDFYSNYTKAIQGDWDKIRDYIKSHGTLTMDSWGTDKQYSTDYYMSKGNDTIIMKGLTYQYIHYYNYNITKMELQIYNNNTNKAITDRKDVVFVKNPFRIQKNNKYIINTFTCKGSNSIEKNDDLYVQTFITYKGPHSSIIESVPFYPAKNNKNIFNKLQYIDYRFDFQNNLIINRDNTQKYIKPTVTNVISTNSLIAVKNGTIKDDSINKIYYYYGLSESSSSSQVIVYNNGFKESYITFYTKKYDINSGNKWKFIPKNYIYQVVEINKSIIIDDPNVNNSNICTVKNGTSFTFVPPPIYLKAVNYNPLYYEISGKSYFNIDISLYPNSTYTLNIVTGSESSSINDSSSYNPLVGPFKGTTKGFKGNITYELKNNNLSGNTNYHYLYAYLTVNNITSQLSNYVNIPVNDISVPNKIGYSNFWPYYFTVDSSYNPSTYGNYSGGPIEIYKDDSKISTREGYIIYRDTINSSLNKTNIKYDIPKVIENGNYFFVKGYNQDNIEIISLSDIDPFSSAIATNPIPIEFPIPDNMNEIQIYNTNMFGDSSGILGRYEIKGILLLNTLVSYNVNSDDYKSSNANNIKGTKDKFKFINKVKGSISNCKSSYGSLSSTNDLFSIMDKGVSIELNDIQFGKKYSIKNTNINKYLSTFKTEKGNAYCSLASTTSIYAVTYKSTPTEEWIFKKTTSSNASLNVVSWGYERYGTFTGIYKSDNIIFSSSNIIFDVGIRQHEIDNSGSLIPKYIMSDNKHIKSSFVNFIEKPFYYSSPGVINLSILRTLSMDLNIATLYYGINNDKLFMMGIKGTNSIWCDKEGNNKGKADNFNNLISKLYTNSIDNQVYDLKGQTIKSNISINDLKAQDYYNDINNQKTIYIKQFNIPYVSNTKQYDDKSRKKTVTEVKSSTQKLAYTNSGGGGQFSTIYMNNDLSNINNIFCIAGGGGGSGIYSEPSFKATKTIYDGHDGCALVKKVMKKITKDDFKASMNYMDGGSCGVFQKSETKPEDPVYEIPSSSLGGSVHTFKNLFNPTQNYYAKPSNPQYAPNYGFYPNFSTSDKKQSKDNLIIRPPMNGKPFYTVKGNNIQYKGILYEVDSFGLEKSGANYGNGGSAMDKGIITYNTPPIDNWGINGNTIDYTSDSLYRNNLTYSQGGGGGGGFGGGSAGTYFFYQKGANVSQKLNNVPPGGGGGGNSFYNVKHNGLTYGINSQNIKSDSKQIPSILPQMLKLALPKKIKGFANNEYLKGRQRMYMYIYTGKGSQK